MNVGESDDGAKSPSSRSVEGIDSKLTKPSAPGRGDHKLGKLRKKDKENMERPIC